MIGTNGLSLRLSSSAFRTPGPIPILNVKSHAFIGGGVLRPFHTHQSQYGTPPFINALCSTKSRPLPLSSSPKRLQTADPFWLQRHRLSFTPNHRLQLDATSTQKGSNAKRTNDSFLSRLFPKSLAPTTESTSSLSKIMQLASSERRTISLAVGCLFISSAVSMSVPFTIGRLIDYFSSPNPELFLGLTPTSALAVLLFVFTGGALANAGRVILLRTAGQRIVSKLRADAYKAALRQDVEYVERGAGEGDLISRLNVDAGIVGESVTQNLSDGLRSIVTASVGLTAMYWLSPTMTLLMLSIVPPVSLGAVVYGRYIKRISNKTQEAVGDMSKVGQESLHALRTVQAFGAYKTEETKFDTKVWDVANLVTKEAKASGIFFGTTGWSGNVTVLMLLGYGGTLVSRGEISVGDLTSLLLYTAYVGSSLGMLTSFFSSIMKGIGAGTRVFELLERQPTIRPGIGEQFPDPRITGKTGTIKFENVSFKYPTRPKVNVLQDFNLTLKSGESVAIVGKSGTGKTSVHSLLLRFYDPDEGRITYDGKDIRDFAPESWRSFIGVVPQDPILFTGTIESNIAYGNPSASRGEIETAARQANCDFIWDMPQGFDTEVGRASLSGGQKQRIAIARALLTKPTLLCLDEATSALDAASELQVNDAIDRILRAGNLTSLIVAHRLSTIARAERVVVLEGGRVVEEGTYAELASKQDSQFRRLMQAQFSAATSSKGSMYEPGRVLEPVREIQTEQEDDSVSGEEDLLEPIGLENPSQSVVPENTEERNGTKQ